MRNINSNFNNRRRYALYPYLQNKKRENILTGYFLFFVYIFQRLLVSVGEIFHEL